MGEFTTEGGGVHPGKPIIWPTGKPTSAPVSSSPESQTAGGVRGVPPRSAPAKTGEAAPTTQTPETAAPAVPAKAAPSVARPLTIEDIRAHLLNNLQINPTDFNTKLASLMLRNGLELSRTNFIKLTGMLQGTNKSQAMQEAAILLLMKGIDSPAAVQILGQFFAENPGMAAQYLALHEGLGGLTSALGMGKGLLDPGLVSQLGAILTQFDETLKNMSQKLSGEKGVSQQNVINGARALKALLAGVQEKTPGTKGPEAKALAASIKEFGGKLDGILDNLVAQAVLSQKGRSEVNYLYHQIPNAMTDPPKDFEIIIKREGEGKNATVDPRNTQVVMSMETENMGKMVVSMIVKDNKVYVIFVFSEKDYGNHGREMIAKEFGDLQQKLSNRNFLITGYQVKVDPAMCNIRPYLMPMMPRLEDLLKRIDIEA